MPYMISLNSNFITPFDFESSWHFSSIKRLGVVLSLPLGDDISHFWLIWKSWLRIETHGFSSVHIENMLHLTFTFSETHCGIVENNIYNSLAVLISRVPQFTPFLHIYIIHKIFSGRGNNVHICFLRYIWWLDFYGMVKLNACVSDMSWSFVFASLSH